MSLCSMLDMASAALNASLAQSRNDDPSRRLLNGV